MAKYVVESGSSSSGATSKRPYDAMVYIDGTSVIAVDNGGNVIKRGIAGTDDRVVIQDALNNVANNGSLFIKGGAYSITSAALTIGASNCSVFGESGWGTRLIGNNISTVIYATGKSNINIENIGIGGTGTLPTYGIQLASQTICKINRCTFENLVTGIYLNNFGDGIIITNNYMENCSTYGIHSRGAAQILISNNNIVRSSANQFTTSAIFVTTSTEVTTTRSVINGNIIRSPTGDGIQIKGKNMVCANNVIQVDGTYSIKEIADANTENNVIGNNRIISGSILRGSTTTIIYHNKGYDTESTGTAATITAGNTYVDVTHSLAATPTKVRVTPTTNLGTRSFWADTKGAATFRININSSDVIDHTFDWEAEV